MRLVIDANEIFSFFNAKSKARELALRFDVLLFSPYFAIDEIKKHELSVRKRFSLSERQFSLILRFLQYVITFVPMSEYEEFVPEAERISPDPNDIDFLALALKLQSPLWSQDKALKSQLKVEVLSTAELVKKLE